MPMPAVHEWVSFDDPDEDRTWVFDVTFLTSRWTCIFGQGCQGVLTAPAPELIHGCCSYGAHMVDDADLAHLEETAATLSAEEWQYKAKGDRNGIVKTNKHGETITRLVDGACIFLNRPGFPTGPGCALHQVALTRGRKPLELKPEVCWQVPLRRDDQVAEDGHVTSTITQWDRRHWGAGGQEFAWWCTESPEAYVGAVPVYEEMRAELKAMAGRKVYKLLATYLEDRAQRVSVPLAHPVTLLPTPDRR